MSVSVWSLPDRARRAATRTPQERILSWSVRGFVHRAIWYIRRGMCSWVFSKAHVFLEVSSEQNVHVMPPLRDIRKLPYNLVARDQLDKL